MTLKSITAVCCVWLLFSCILTTPCFAKGTFYISAGSQKIGKVEDGRMYYYINDPLGSPRVILDENEKEVWSSDYHPFGTSLNEQSTAHTETNTFTGKPFDRETGLYYYGARYYDPVIGRFVSLDQTRQYASPYVYGSNNPLIMVDPSGSASMRVSLARGLGAIPIIFHPDSALCNWIGGFEYSWKRAVALGYTAPYEYDGKLPFGLDPSKPSREEIVTSYMSDVGQATVEGHLRAMMGIAMGADIDTGGISASNISDILEPIPMLEKYIGEDVQLEDQIHYMSEAERVRHHVTFKIERFTLLEFSPEAGKQVQAARLYDASGTELLNGWYWYVMGKNVDFYVKKLPDNYTGAPLPNFRHSSFFAGQPVYGSGEIRVENGILLSITNSSGHYRPTFEHLMNTIKGFEYNGVTYGIRRFPWYPIYP